MSHASPLPAPDPGPSAAHPRESQHLRSDRNRRPCPGGASGVMRQTRRVVAGFLGTTGVLTREPLIGARWPPRTRSLQSPQRGRAFLAEGNSASCRARHSAEVGAGP